MLRRQITALTLIAGACLAAASPAWADATETEHSASRPQEDTGIEHPADIPQAENQRETSTSERKRREADRLMQHLNDAALRVGTGEEHRIPWLRLR